MEDAASAMWDADGASGAAGVRLLEVAAGRAVAALRVEQRHLNGHGIVHGGYVFLLADTAMAFASNTGAPAVASGADIAFLRPARLGADLVAEAVERAAAGRSGLWDVTVRDGDAVVAEFRGRTRLVPGLGVGGQQTATRVQDGGR